MRKEALRDAVLHVLEHDAPYPYMDACGISYALYLRGAFVSRERVVSALVHLRKRNLVKRTYVYGGRPLGQRKDYTGRLVPTLPQRTMWYVCSRKDEISTYRVSGLKELSA